MFRAPAPHVADLLLGQVLNASPPCAGRAVFSRPTKPENLTVPPLQPGTRVPLTVRRTKEDGSYEFLDVSVVRARTDPVSARKAVYEAFLSTSGQKTDSPRSKSDA